MLVHKAALPASCALLRVSPQPPLVSLFLDWARGSKVTCIRMPLLRISESEQLLQNPPPHVQHSGIRPTSGQVSWASSAEPNTHVCTHTQTWLTPF